MLAQRTPPSTRTENDASAFAMQVRLDLECAYDERDDQTD